MVEHRVLQAATVMRRGQGEEGRPTTGGVEDRGAFHGLIVGHEAAAGGVGGLHWRTSVRASVPCPNCSGGPPPGGRAGPPPPPPRGPCAPPPPAAPPPRPAAPPARPPAPP